MLVLIDEFVMNSYYSMILIFLLSSVYMNTKVVLSLSVVPGSYKRNHGTHDGYCSTLYGPLP